MKKVYKNVVIWDASEVRARRCDLLTEGGRISDILPTGSGAAVEQFDGRGRTAIIPGLVNAHTHIAMSILRGLGEDLPLMDWLRDKIWPVENKLTEEMVFTATKLGMMEMLSTGTTSFMDMYFFTRQTAGAALEAGMRCNVTRAVAGDDERAEAQFKESLQIADEYHGAKGLVKVSVGPHANYTVPEGMMQKCVDAALDRKLNIHFHWLETEWEREYLRGSIKLAATDYLEKFGFMKAAHLLLAHCVYICPDDIAFYARPNVTVAHNPKSNLKLASGIAPVPQMLAAGVNVALGTDGAASNNRLDLWDELRFSALLHKGAVKDPTVVSASQALAMATLHGAAALGFDDLGLLAEGYLADMVLIDLDKPHYVGWNEDNLAAFLVYAGSSQDVMATIVAGNTLYENGEFATIDKRSVMASAEKARDFLTGN